MPLVDEMPELIPQLTLYITEIGREAGEAPELSMRPKADLADIRAWRYYRASPTEFFYQYARDFYFDHVHVAFDALSEAVKLLADHVVFSLVVAGHVGAQRLEKLKTACAARGIVLILKRLPASRALTGDDSGLRWRKTPDEALAEAGISPQTTLTQPALYWSAWFNRFYADEVLPVLRVRDAGIFFGFMKALSEVTAQGLNWAGLGKRCGISGPSARDWSRFLEDAGVIDLVAPQRAQPPRRAKLRPKLYWNAPGLALWLSDAVSGCTPAMHRALFENAVYLAEKDRCPESTFAHFLDTNAVRAPLMRKEAGGAATAYYFPDSLESFELALKHHASLERARLASGAARIVTEGPSPFPMKGDVSSLPVLL